MHKKRFHPRFDVWFLAIAGIPALLRGQSSPPPSLGSAASFAVLGGSSVTSSGSTIITGNLGVSPGNTINGSPTVKIGATYRNDSVARQAQKDAAAAYNELASRTPCTVIGPIVSNTTLTRGVYCLASPAQLTGTLTLNAEGDPTAVWIFQIAGAFTTAPGSHVVTTNGGQAGKVFWQVGSSALLGAHSTFLGNLLALTSITLNNGVSVSGRLIARTGDVTLDTNDASLCCDPINLDPPTLPDGTTGTAYNQTITASGGMPPYIFTIISGSLPTGLNPLSPGGVLSGSPTKAGRFPVTVMATDSQGCTGSRAYTIRISCPAITVINPVVTTGPACAPFSQTFRQRGGVGPIKFTTDSTLPAGLELHESTGVLDGKPNQHGLFPIVVTATDANGCSGTGSSYDLEITCPAITVTNPAVTAGTAGVAFSETFTQSGGGCTTTFSILSGTLPTGLTLNPSTGCLQGTPTQTGSFPIVVRALSSSGCTGDGPTYPLVINCQTITVTNPINTTGTVNTSFSETFSQTGAIGGATFSLDKGPLPAGLTLHANGVLDGIPTQAGSFPITVMATDVNGCIGIGGSYPLLINPPPCVLTLSPATLPTGWPGVPYSEAITASGGTAPYALVASGTLPPGLTFLQTTPTTATISGTPTTVGCFDFTVTVTDASGCPPKNINYTICVATGGPTLSGWGMIVLSALLVGAGFVMMREV